MNGKTIVHVVKTFDGALWAVQQVENLIKSGWDVHVVSPVLEGRYLDIWKKTGARLHSLPCEFPTKRPWEISQRVEKIRSFFLDLRPSLVHSHFVSTTLMLRYALKGIPIPRIFQVPGPLHLEHAFFGQWETFWSDEDDYWIASSKFIKNLYHQKYGIRDEKVFLSYYGTDIEQTPSSCSDSFRQRIGLNDQAIMVGNVSFIYPPKRYLGQRVGLKGHELMIDSLAELMAENSNLWGIFIGQQWGKSQAYFEKIKKHALKKSKRFIFTGAMPQKEIMSIWNEFDLALHLPSSENCGGVIEPMLNGVPAVASSVGGLPEVIIPGKTGYLIPDRSIDSVTTTLREAIHNLPKNKRLPLDGQSLVKEMFNVKRTALEIDGIYRHILFNDSLNTSFDAHTFLEQI